MVFLICEIWKERKYFLPSSAATRRYPRAVARPPRSARRPALTSASRSTRCGERGRVELHDAILLVILKIAVFALVDVFFVLLLFLVNALIIINLVFVVVNQRLLFVVGGLTLFYNGVLNKIASTSQLHDLMK